MKSLKLTFGAKIKLSKLEVARRQLETAIVLFFKGGDTVSTHTLSTAAAEVIRDLNSSRSGRPMTFESLAGVVKPEYEDFLKKKFREAQNFFKHADRDPEGVLEFNSELTVFFLFDAVEKYFELSGETPPILKVFSIWFRASFPKIFSLNNEDCRRIATLTDLCAHKEKFFAEILPGCFPVTS